MAALGAVLAFWLATVVLVDRELHSSLDAALRSRAIAVAELAVSDPGLLTAPGALESPVSGRQMVVQVIDARGRILARSLTLGSTLIPEGRHVRQVLHQGRAIYESVSLAGRPFRVLIAPIAEAGGPASGGAVLVASDTADIGDTLHRLELILGLTGLAVAALTILAASALTARGTGPLRRLASAAGEIERTADPARRLPDSARDDEIGRLTGVLNRMLAALERSRLAERRFLADASHELRTPVTGLLGNVEFLARHGATPELVDDLRSDAARLARLIDDLLVLEREAGATDIGDRVALDQLVREAVDERAGQPIRVTRLDAVEIAGDQVALGRALANLLENAAVHGPLGGAITVELTGSGGEARLTVSDAGPGPPPEERAHVFERFWRGTSARGRPGSGLGLAIVASVAERHGGRVELQGSAFTLALPLPRAGIASAGGDSDP